MSQLLWTQKQDVGPAARSNSAMAFDSTKDRTLLFGGALAGPAGSTPSHDTWEWDGDNWTQVADTGPRSRSDHALAYDSARNRIVMFGGSSGSAYFNDTWEWDGTEWTQVEDTGPAQRSGMGMCFDSKRALTVMFGGGAGTTRFNDTWVWDGTSWTQEDDGGPPPRTLHRMDYDSARSRIVLFGGNTLTTKQIQIQVANTGLFATGSHAEYRTVASFQYLNDTWEYDGTMWTRVEDIGPAPRDSFGFSYSGKVMLLFGGTDAGNAFRDTWQWDGSNWTQRQDIG
ncbi:MAG TPA: kelch repeat-containing protein, partial [Gemmatimonadaceae bacterium]|nr:kelch repeat-containing protein [Gemmatimonadaceae bacterium]